MPPMPALRDRARTVWRRADDQHLSQVAAGVAFWLSIAVFPAGLVIVNVVGLVVDQETVARFVGRFVSATPGSLGDTVAQQLKVVAAPTPGTIVTDALLVVVAVWTVSTAMHHLIRGIQLAYGVEPAGVVLVRALAIAAAIGAVAALGVAAWVLDLATLAGSALGYAASAVTLTLLTALVYRLAIKAPFREQLPGALAAAACFVVIAFGLELYSVLGQNLRLIYGSVAGVLISMLGLWLGVLAVLLGAALNGRRLETDLEPHTDA